MDRRSGILIMIGYDADIGFAIGRLIGIFLEMGVRFTGSKDRVHFSFRETAGKTCRSLPDGFSNVTAFDYSQNDAPAVERLCRYIRTNEIHTVFALDMPVQCACLGALRRAGIQKVISYWGAPMSSMMSPFMLALKRIEVAIIRRSKPDYFIFESESMRSYGVRGRGLSKSRTAIIPTGIDETRFSRNPEWSGIAHERFNISKDRRIVVFMGHMHERKGVHVLVQAAEHLAASMGRSDIHVLFLGNTDDEAKKYSKYLDVAQDFVTFGGYHSDIPQVLSGCDIGCVPSTGWDSFPMSSLEMQACGLPVVASDLQGVPETLHDGVTGMVVPAGDPKALANALASLVDDSVRRLEMSEAARRRIEGGYTKEIQINSLVEFLEAVT